MDPRPTADEARRSTPVSAESLLRDADPPPLSEVLAQHAEPASPETRGSLDEALRANPRPDVYEPLAGPASE